MCLFKQSFWRVRCSAKLPSSIHPRGFASLASQTESRHHPLTLSDFQPKAFWESHAQFKKSRLVKCGWFFFYLYCLKIPLISTQGLQLLWLSLLAESISSIRSFSSCFVALWLSKYACECKSLAYCCDIFLQFTQFTTKHTATGLRLKQDSWFVKL